MFVKFKGKHEEFMNKKSVTRCWHVGDTDHRQLAVADGNLKVTVEHVSGLWVSPFNHTVTNKHGNYCSKGSALTHVADLIPRNTQH